MPSTAGSKPVAGNACAAKRCLLCYERATYTKTETWLDTSISLCESLLELVGIEKKAEYSQTFMGSFFCQPCIANLVNLSSLMEQLIQIQNSIYRMRRDLEALISVSYGKELRRIKRKRKTYIHETPDMQRLRNIIHEATGTTLEDLSTLYNPPVAAEAVSKPELESKNLRHNAPRKVEEQPIRLTAEFEGLTEAAADEVEVQMISDTNHTPNELRKEPIRTGRHSENNSNPLPIRHSKRQVKPPERYASEFIGPSLISSDMDSRSQDVDVDRGPHNIETTTGVHEPESLENNGVKTKAIAVHVNVYAYDDEGEEVQQKKDVPARLLKRSLRGHAGPLFKCTHSADCRTWLKSEEDVRIHILRHHQGVKRPYKCDQCEKSFEYKSKLTTHYMLHTGERPFACEQCDFTCRAENHLKEHVTMHTGKKRYKCDVCKKGFMSQFSYKAHLRSHNKERPYICEVCGEGFITNQILRNHQTKHDELPFGPIACHICGKQLSSPNNLKCHMRRHNNKFELHCPICNKGVDNSSQLERHLICHSKERNFACTECPKTYLLKCHLTTHMKRHTNTRPHECTICFKRFYERRLLTSHMTIHSGESPFDCHLCEKKFSASSHRDIHVYRHLHPQSSRKAPKVKNNQPSRKVKEFTTTPEAVPPEYEQHQNSPAQQFIMPPLIPSEGANTQGIPTNFLVHDLNAIPPDTIIIQIPEGTLFNEQEQLDLTSQLAQPLDEAGITFQCNAEGVVEFCTFRI